jgi:hypothetical protein
MVITYPPKDQCGQNVAFFHIKALVSNTGLRYVCMLSAIAFRAKNLEICGRGASAFGERYYVVKFKVFVGTTLDTSPTVSFPNG